MFAVIYQAYLKLDRESEYKYHWHKVASYFIEHCGAIGSCLHQAEDGLWLAYSRWPDRMTRDASWRCDNIVSNTLPDEIKESILVIKDCLDPTRMMPDICMDVVDDLL